MAVPAVPNLKNKYDVFIITGDLRLKPAPENGGRYYRSRLPLGRGVSWSLNLNNFSKNLALLIGLTMLMVVVFNLFKPPTGVEEKSYTEIVAAATKGELNHITIKGQQLTAVTKNNQKWLTYIPNDPDLVKTLREHQVSIHVLPPSPPYLYSFISGLVQIVIFIAIFIFLMRQMQASGGKAMSFGKSRAKMFTEENNKVTFKDVAGIDEAKAELEEIIDFLRDPKKFMRLGGRIPKGVLLMGPPGTGKTLLARAIAGEAGVPFFSISGSDFVEMFVGVGASRVRDLFVQGKKQAPCIAFIDEIDAVGRHRGAGLGGGHDEREQTLNQLLVEMDGFEHNEGLILIAATNRPDVLDPALLRPGRFDRQVVVPVPDLRGREQILAVHARNVPLADDVDLAAIARGTPGFSGADLENLINEGALLAARRNKERVEAEDLDAAKDKITMGVERKSMIISEKEKRTTAWHEAGHALVSVLTPGADPLHKVTIIPRGRALGLTQQLPVDEKYTYEKNYLLGQLVLLMGGRAAEELALNQMTTGAGNDIERATELARKMVCEWGMSENLGPMSFGKKDEQIFLGREISQHRDYSESTAVRIDEEVKKLVASAHQKALDLLGKYQATLDSLAERLLEKETLEAREVLEIAAAAIKAEGLPDPGGASPA